MAQCPLDERKSRSTHLECNTRTRIKICCSRPATETIMTVRSIEGSNVHSNCLSNDVSATKFQPLAPRFYSPSHCVCFLSAKTTSCKFAGVGAKAADQVLAVPRSFRAAHILGTCTVTGAFVPALSPRKSFLMLGYNPPTSHADHHYIYLAQRISLSYGSTRTTFLPISHTCVPVRLHYLTKIKVIYA